MLIKATSDVAIQFTRRLVSALAAVLGVVSVLIALSWFSGSNDILFTIPGHTPTRLMSCVCIFLLSISILLSNQRSIKRGWLLWVERLTAVVPILLSCSAIFTHFTPAPSTATESWYLMSVQNSIAMVLAGIGLLFTSIRNPNAALMSQLCAVSIAFISILAILGYFYNFPVLVHLGIHTRIAFSVAVLELLMAVALFFIRAQEGIAAIFVSSSVGGVVARRLLPACLLVPALGLISPFAHHEDHDFLIILMLVNFGLPVCIWMVANMVDDLEKSKREADLEVTQLTEQQGLLSELFMNSANSLIKILSDILELSSFANQGASHMADFEPRTVLEQALDDRRVQIAQKGIRTELSIKDTLPCVKGNPLLLSKVMHNLLDNSIKFTNQGVIKIEASRKLSDDQVMMLIVSVNDSGVGMSEPQISALQKRLKSKDLVDAIKDSQGIGLLMVRKILDIAGGDLAIESEPGQGTSMTVHIPYKSTKESVSC